MNNARINAIPKRNRGRSWLVPGLILCAAPLLVLAAARPAAGGAREKPALSFEDRVRAQEAIERVRHAHQIGDTRPFEVAVPRGLLESRVRTFLKESAALDRFWRGRVTAEMLRDEMQRMSRRTRMPERLAELHAALGNDPRLIQECLVRPILTQRLLRNAVASDPEDGRSYQEWWSDVESRLEAGPVDVVATDEGLVGGTDAAASSAPTACGAANTWDNGSLDDDPEPMDLPGAVWTGTEMLVFGGLDSSFKYGVRYDPVLDSWSPMSLVNAPSQRSGHAMVWTGSRLFVWGGLFTGTTGGLYDPATDTWTATSTIGAPSNRRSMAAVWTGSRVVIWGGQPQPGGGLNDGGRYDPATDTWAPTSLVNAPAGRLLHTGIWTGSRLVVWGGSAGGPWFNTGGRYDPVNDTWSPTSTVNAPTARDGHTAVWTGTQMIIWGGTDMPVTGGRYDPVADTWTPTSTVNTPPPRRLHTAVWTGSRMVIWGGEATLPVNTGGRYNPATDTWESMSVTNAPPGRRLHVAVWTGSRMVVWGGDNFYTGLNSGGRYDPIADSWTPTFLSGTPSQRRGFTSVWTGSDMIVWGGDEGRPSLASGARYDPATDAWTPTTSTGAPPAATFHTAVWTGHEMIVWGGRGTFTPPQDAGGRYDPLSDTWAPITMSGAPAARYDHTAIWTGSRMLVWGGTGSAGALGTGAAYDPDAGTWAPLTTAGAPIPRANHAAVWTGSRMVLWGGYDGTNNLQSGGRYDPSTDTWEATSLTAAPFGRAGASAVWTGTRMVVWGGYTTTASTGADFGTRSGGRYDPAADTWAPITLTGAPSTRYYQSGVWTGHAMVIWGGVGGSPVVGLNSGAFYDPVTDGWTAATATAAVPTPRWSHRAVWTGNAMLVWGGQRNGWYLTTGGLLCGCTGPVGTWYQDVDADGHGAATVAQASCAQPAGFVTTGDDCDDLRATVHPGAAEICDGLDNGCDGGVDEGGASLCDDANACTASLCQGAAGCAFPPVGDGFPCDDGSACTIGDACAGGSCHGTPRDADGDTHPDAACGGDDCNDGDAQVWSAPPEVTGFSAVSQGPVTFAWDDLGPVSGPGTVHGVVSGGLLPAFGMDFGDATCLASGPETSYTDLRPDPPPGLGSWYLVRGSNACGGGSFGSATLDEGLPACP
jgi:hypothetical protein